MKNRHRILITKVGLDAHDRGLKIITHFLMEAGYEVIYIGIHQTPEEIVQAAVQEDVDLIGIGSLCGAHFSASKVIKLLEEKDRSKVPVVVGGIVPSYDVNKLTEDGVKKIFGPGTSSEDLVAGIASLLGSA